MTVWHFQPAHNLTGTSMMFHTKFGKTGTKTVDFDKQQTDRHTDTPTHTHRHYGKAVDFYKQQTDTAAGRQPEDLEKTTV